MATVVVRGLILVDRRYLLASDVLLWMAAVGERPNLNDDQRALLTAMMKDLRESTFEQVDGEGWS